MGKKVTLRKESSYRRLETSLPRNEMIQVLQPSADPRVQQLLEMLLSSNPEVMKLSLPNIAAQCRLSYAELVREIAKGRVTEGVLRMSKHIPKVLEDTALDARSKNDICDACSGTGQVIENRPQYKKSDDVTWTDCAKCNGKGKIRRPGNTEARKLVFEAAGLTNKRGPAVNVNVRNGGGNMPSVESEMSSLDRILDIQPVKAAS